LEDLVPGGPASASGQLQAGDRIVAVGDANGRWVDARNVRLGEVVGLIRGEPNTQVSLRIQSPGDAAPRAVTLGRQQIIHSPQ
jgi:carboxyl-terminal processing protease